MARTEIIEVTAPDAKKPWKPLPEDEIAEVFDAFFRDLFSRFHVDPDRVYVIGLSQTGFWAWILGRLPRGSLRGDRADVGGDVAGRPRRRQPRPRSRSTCCTGTRTRPATSRRRAQWRRRLEALGVDVRYKEIARRRHDESVWSNLPEGLKWLAREAARRGTPRAS